MDFRHSIVLEHVFEPSEPRNHCLLSNLCVPRDTDAESRGDTVEKSGRCQSIATANGLHIDPISQGKQIPLCSQGKGCSRQGGIF